MPTLSLYHRSVLASIRQNPTRTGNGGFTVSQRPTTTMLLIITPIILILSVPVDSQDPHLARLAAELQSPETAIRRQAATSLGRASSLQSVRLLRDSMSIEIQPEVRLAILRALRRIAFQRYPGYREALEALGQATNHKFEPDELVRLRATEAMWEVHKRDLMDPVPLLKRILADPRSALRLQSVRTLKLIGTAATIPVLGGAAIDHQQSVAVRFAAVDALGAVALQDLGPIGTEVAAANIRTARLQGIPPLVNPHVLKRHHQLQVGYLAQIVRDSNSSSALTLGAVKSMGRIKDRSTIPVLQEIIETHKDQAVRRQAGKTLSHVIATQYE